SLSKLIMGQSWFSSLSRYHGLVFYHRWRWQLERLMQVFRSLFAKEGSHLIVGYPMPVNLGDASMIKAVKALLGEFGGRVEVADMRFNLPRRSFDCCLVVAGAGLEADKLKRLFTIKAKRF